jgi:hypothetical protein
MSTLNNQMLKGSEGYPVLKYDTLVQVGKRRGPLT